VAQYRAAEPAKRKKLTGFFVGQIMKASKGQANPKLVNELLLGKTRGGITMRKDKAKVLDEQWDDARVASFLELRPATRRPRPPRAAARLPQHARGGLRPLHPDVRSRGPQPRRRRA
jgi:hypothetical protein